MDRHVAIAGFMGAGKTTVGEEAAARLGRPFVDVDRELERRAGATVAELFRDFGEPHFRAIEEELVVELLAGARPAVLALGGGAVLSPAARAALREQAVTVVLEIDPESAWSRVEGAGRPLARSKEDFLALYEARGPVYAEVADEVVRDVDDVVLAAAGVHVETGALARIGELVPGSGPAALVFDAHVAGIHGADAQLALGPRLASAHELPVGEEAKTVAAVERLWNGLRIGRRGVLVALGGGCTTDAAGFVAATYLRGIDWIPVPTTLVGQVDAAIGGKTAIDLVAGKNLVGAFHWPARVVLDPALLATLPERERREGMAEVVKTGLLAGEPLWELPEHELVRRCAAFKAAVCLRDPLERGERAILNLGHTFAHALEAGGGYEAVTHGRAVALGLLAALRLSGRPTDLVVDLLDPKPVRVDRDRAWAALGRDKKHGLVLLGDDGPVWDVEVAETEVRRELDRLIAG